MYTSCIAVVDASRARLFTLQRTSDAGGLREDFLEQRDLVNPARRRTSELFSSTRPGVARAGGVQYGLDDHRDAHVDKLDADFSRVVIEQLAALAASIGATRSVICASPSMLGELRGARAALAAHLELDEVDRNLVKLTPPRLREQLASYGVLPEPPPRAIPR